MEVLTILKSRRRPDKFKEIKFALMDESCFQDMSGLGDMMSEDQLEGTSSHLTFSV